MMINKNFEADFAPLCVPGSVVTLWIIKMMELQIPVL